MGSRVEVRPRVGFSVLVKVAGWLPYRSSWSVLRRFFFKMACDDAVAERGLVEMSTGSERARSLRWKKRLSLSIREPEKTYRY